MGLETAAIIGITSAASALASTGMSFAQASKQKKMQQKAEKEADEAMARARKELDVNFYEGLAIQKEPYELEREALLSSGAQLVGAGAEADPRLLAAIGGRVQQLQQKGQRQIASAMGQELAGLEKLAASEEKARAQRLASLDLEEAAGAQLAARDAEEARATATTQAMQGVGDILGQAASLAPLFGKTGGARQLARAERIGARRGVSADNIQQALGTGNRTINGVDVSQVGSMNRQEFQDFMGQQDRAFGRQMRQDLGLQSEFNPFNIF